MMNSWITICLMLNILVLLADGILNELPQIVTQPDLHIYAFPGDKVVIPCKVTCNNCTDKIDVWWEKDAVRLATTLYQFSNDSLVINSFNHLTDTGSYTCIYMYKSLGIRSTACHLRKAELPIFLIESQETELNGTAVFKCVNKYDAEVRWLKEGQFLVRDNHYVIENEYLFIYDVQSWHSGQYSCQYQLKQRTQWHKSEKRYLNLTNRSILTPKIVSVTQHQKVSYHDNVSLHCVSSGSSDTVVRIFKVSDHDMETKLVEKNVFVTYTITEFDELSSGTYVCEAELFHVRVRKKIKLDLIVKLKLTYDGITHLDTKTGNQVASSCKPNVVSGTEVTWYHNGLKIKENDFFSIDGAWLEISHIQKANEGIYQCIAENLYGSDTKLFYVTVGDSGLAPVNLKVIKLSPTKVKLSWNSPANTDIDTYKMYYRVYWTHPNGEVLEDFTMENGYIVNNRIFGGLIYDFKVCTFFTWSYNVRDCVQKTETMLEAIPTIGPSLLRPSVGKNKVFNLKWEPIGEEYDMGVIKSYTIYCKQLFVCTKNQTNEDRLEQFHVIGNETSTVATLKRNGIYKVWMVAHNSAGSSPSSKVFIASTEEMWNPDDDEINFRVTWTFRYAGYQPYLKWNLVNKKAKAWKYKIYYVEIPYKDYWKSVKTITVDRYVNSYQISTLDSKKLYRFTIAAVYQRIHKSQPKDSFLLGNRTHVILHDINFEKEAKSRLLGHDTIAKPFGLSCVGTSKHSMLISWNAPTTKFEIKNYLVYIKSEMTDEDVIYSVADTHVLVSNLTDIWYAVRVHANNDELKSNVTFFEAGYISCRTQIEAASRVRSSNYTVLHDKKTKDMYLVVTWKPPLYTGKSIYSYELRRLPVQMSNPIKFPFDNVRYQLMMDTQYGDRLYSEPLKIAPGSSVHLNYKIAITPINDAGPGEGCFFVTDSIHKASVIDDEHNGEKDALSTDDDTSSHVKLGVLIGLSVTVVFIVIFVVVVIIKEPCRKKEPPSARRKDDSYLYIQKHDAVHSVSSDNTVGSSIGTTTDSKHNKTGQSCHAKYSLIRPFQSMLVKRFESRDGSSIVTQHEILSDTSSACSACSSNNSNHGIGRGPVYCSKCRSSSLYVSSASEERESADSISQTCSLKAASSTSSRSNFQCSRSTGEESSLLDNSSPYHV